MDPLSATLSQVTAALRRLRIRYAVGGSVASSARGVWRSTLDIDLIAAIRPESIAALAAELGPDWYVDDQVIRDAVRTGRPFNLIQKRLAYKVDVFPATDEFHESQLKRATTIELTPDKIPCAVTSPEDILLAKLRWFQDGGEISERQWSDITALIGANPDLDRPYLEGWAGRIGVDRLLEKAFADSTQP
jgi:hypothetical protein